MDPDTAQPTVVLIAGLSGDGKSTLAGGLISPQISVCSLDSFSILLSTSWCPDDFIRKWSIDYLREHRISEFWKKVVAENKSEVVMDLFFTTETYKAQDHTPGTIRGRPVRVGANATFAPRGPLSLIEGYLPTYLQELLIKKLKKRGYRVWIMQRSK